MSVQFTIALAFSVLMQDPAASQATQNATPAKSAENQAVTVDLPDDNERICKKITLVGSRLKQRVCATRAEWRAAEEQSQELTERLQRVANISRPRG